MKDTLISRIKSTNNGYLFAPTDWDVKIARNYPETFEVLHRPGHMFPYRISIK
jgi:hypothetical protein